MKNYLNKFDEQYKGKKSIDIEIFNEEPFSMKYVRYNQSGVICHCMTNSNTANLKNKSGWQQIECNSNCQYRQKNEYGKSSCNRIGWLKFLVPSICKDRIFLMKITGQTSLNRLNDYFNFQKSQGNSLKGIYTIFLKQEEQTNSLGQTFNNYILDILKKEDFISIKPIPQTTQNSKDLSTTSTQNVNNKVEKQEIIEPTTKKNTMQQTTNVQIENSKQEEIQENKKTASKENKTTTTKKEVKSKSKKVEQKQEERKTETITNVENEDLDNCYALLRTFNQNLVNKQGESKEYLIGEFADMNDKILNIVIKPEDAQELAQCDLGTYVKIDVKDIADKKFAMKLEFIEKRIKNIAA